MRVLGIGAHPDDIEIGCGGTLAMHRQKGDSVHGILCTLGGVRGDPNTRRNEALLAAKILDIELHILDFPVAELNGSDIPSRFSKILGKAITDFKPDRIYTHSPFDYHQVHVTVSKSVVAASGKVKQILFYETISSTTTDFKPDAFVDISNFIDVKIRSIEAHESQIADRFYLQPNVTRSLANTRYVWGKVGNNPQGLAGLLPNSF
jgi:LmbE family N-acetylglucosaminyl deacetylase